MAPSDDDRIGVDFIDPLFAVALSLNFEEIKNAPWFSDWSLILRSPHIFEFLTLCLCWLTVILSWVGYHISIKTNPIRLRRFSGWCRFMLDVLLLITYSFLLIKFADFERVLKLLAIIFGFFMLWDVFKKIEHPKREYSDGAAWNRATAQRGVTVLWFAFFLLLAVFCARFRAREAYEDWLCLLAAWFGTVLYRLHKVKLWGRGMLRVLGY